MDTVEPFDGSQVSIMIWHIIEADDIGHDRYESYTFTYLKENIKIMYDGEPLTAMPYIMKEGCPLGQPAGHRRADQRAVRRGDFPGAGDKNL